VVGLDEADGEGDGEGVTVVVAAAQWYLPSDAYLMHVTRAPLSAVTVLPASAVLQYWPRSTVGVAARAAPLPASPSPTAARTTMPAMRLMVISL
jgi:hypothetical protein